MKNLHKILAEMTQAQSPADKAFVALHPVKKTEFVDYPETQFKATTKKDHSKMVQPSNATGMEDDIEKEKPKAVAEAEQIDELSKSTLGSYIKKSADSARVSQQRYSDHIDNYEDREERGDHVNSEKHFKKASDAVRKMRNRTKGIDGAVKRLTKEETDALPFEELAEQNLHEISKKVLGSYIVKAAGDHGTSKRYAAKHEREYHDMVRSPHMSTPESRTGANTVRDAANYETHRARKRLSGIKKATARLTKEDLDDLQELSKDTLSRYIEGADQSKQVHDNGHQDAHSKKMSDKRGKGLETAAKKLKEEALDEGKRAFPMTTSALRAANHDAIAKKEFDKGSKGDELKMDRHIRAADRYLKIAKGKKPFSEQLDEARFDHREAATHGVIHPDAAKFAKEGHVDHDFYSSHNGDKISGKVTKNDGKTVHFQERSGKTHRFKVARSYPGLHD